MATIEPTGSGKGISVTGAGGIGAASGSDLNPPGTEPAKKRVLIVDDEKINRMILDKALRDTYDVTEAISAEDAAPKLATGNFDLVICDNSMGETNEKGIDFLTRVKPNHPDTKFVLHSAELEKDPKQEESPALRLQCTSNGIIPCPKLDMAGGKSFVDGVFASWVGETPTSLGNRPTTDETAVPFPEADRP